MKKLNLKAIAVAMAAAYRGVFDFISWTRNFI